MALKAQKASTKGARQDGDANIGGGLHHHFSDEDEEEENNEAMADVEALEIQPLLPTMENMGLIQHDANALLAMEPPKP